MEKEIFIVRIFRILVLLHKFTDRKYTSASIDMMDSCIWNCILQSIQSSFMEYSMFVFRVSAVLVEKQKNDRYKNHFLIHHEFICESLFHICSIADVFVFFINFH